MANILVLVIFLSTYGEIRISHSRTGSYDDTASIDEQSLQFSDHSSVLSSASSKISVGHIGGMPLWGWPPHFDFELARKEELGMFGDSDTSSELDVVGDLMKEGTRHF